MGANIDIQALLGERNQVLDTVLDSIENWDGSIESGIEIVESCQTHLDKIKVINEKIIESQGMDLYDGEYEMKINLLLKEQRNFTQGLKAKQGQLLGNIHQMKKKREVAENYILGNIDSIFIDKDI